MKKYVILSVLALIFLVSPTISRAQAQWCYNFNTDLSYGASGEDVLALQTALFKLGYGHDNLAFNRNFNSSLAIKLYNWQANNGIAVPISSFGFEDIKFDALSRGKMNDLFGCAGATTPAIEILTPNGNETINVGEPVAINWASSGLPANSRVTLFFQPVGGTGGSIAVVTSNGTHSYTQTFTASTFRGLGAASLDQKYNLTIRGITNNQVFSDISDNSFMITAGPLIISAPIGGEVWQSNWPHMINWSPYDPRTGANSADHITAYLEKLVSGQFTTVDKTLPCGMASLCWSGEIGRDNLNWRLATPGNYYIRIVNNLTGQWSRSPRSFYLAPEDIIWADLKINGSHNDVTVPAGGADYLVSWTSNTDECLIYNATLPPDTSFDTDRIIFDLSPTGSRTIRLSSFYNQSGILLVCTKAGIDGQGNDWITTYGVGGKSASASAAGINTVTTISPNGSERLNLAGDYNISWNSSADVARVSIALYKNDAFYRWIKTNWPSVGAKIYRWRPSDTIAAGEIGDNFKISLIGHKDNFAGIIQDKSDRPFSIVDEPIPQPVLQPILQPIQAPPDNLASLNNTNTNTNTTTVPGQFQPQQTVVSSINYSNPPKGAIDARQLSDWNKVRLYFSPALPAAEAVPSFFSIISANQTAPRIISIDNSSRGRAIDLNLNRAVLPGERILLTHNPSGSSVCLGALPGDVNADGRIMANDLSSLRASLAGEPNSLLPLYRTDINSDGVANVADDASLTALLHARSTTSLNTLPACPPPVGGTGSLSFQTQLANALSSLNLSLQNLKQATVGR